MDALFFSILISIIVFCFHHSATMYRALAIKNVKMEKKVKEEKTHERKKKQKRSRRKIIIVPGILFPRALKKTTTFVHIRTIYSYSYIYAYKTPKNRGRWSLPGSPVAGADSEQCFFRLLGAERLCWLRARGHHSRASFTSRRRPKAREEGGDASKLMYRTWAPPGGLGELSRPEASASVWACRFSPILYSPPPLLLTA